MTDSDTDRETAIAEAVAQAASCSSEAVSGVRLLGGGASKENWAAVIDQNGDERAVVVRTEPENWRFAGSETVSLSTEAALLCVAHGKGVAVPELLFELNGKHGIKGYVMAHVAGETVGGRILKSESLANARSGLAYECGKTLAAIHRLPLSNLPSLESRSPAETVSFLRSQFEETEQDRPVFELALKWLDENTPHDADRALVHGDFRNGNLIVDAEGLRAVLDWETAHLGCPAEDLGWLCVTSWRFQRPELAVGGFGTREQLLEGYCAAGGQPWTLADLRYWEIYGTLRWGIMCAQVAKRFGDGQRSVESAVIARRASETEFDLLRLIAAEGDSDAG